MSSRPFQLRIISATLGTVTSRICVEFPWFSGHYAKPASLGRKPCPVITCWMRSARHFGVGDASQKCHIAIDVRSLLEEARCWGNDLPTLQSGIC